MYMGQGVEICPTAGTVPPAGGQGPAQRRGQDGHRQELEEVPGQVDRHTAPQHGGQGHIPPQVQVEDGVHIGHPHQVQHRQGGSPGGKDPPGPCVPRRQGPGRPGRWNQPQQEAEAGLEHIAQSPAQSENGQARQSQGHIDRLGHRPPSGPQHHPRQGGEQELEGHRHLPQRELQKGPRRRQGGHQCGQDQVSRPVSHGSPPKL